MIRAVEDIFDPLDRTRFPADPWALREVRYNASDLGLTETLFAVGNASHDFDARIALQNAGDQPAHDSGIIHQHHIDDAGRSGGGG